MSKGTKKLSAKQAASMDPHAVAAHFGLYYSGDINPFDHGGLFYSADDWVIFGYADCIEIWPDSDTVRTVLIRGTINRDVDDIEDSMTSFGIDEEDYDSRNSVLVQIEAAFAYIGAEPDDHQPAQSFRTESRMWRHLLVILASMGT